MKTFKESIIDIPRRTYAPGIFDNADTDNPRLKQSIIDIIKSDMEKHVEKYGSVERLTIIGSVLTKTYRNDADLDVDILIKPNAVGEEDIEKVRKDLVFGRFVVHTDPDTNKKTKYYFKNPKKYPESYTKEDIKFLKDQREDVVREEDKS